MRGLYITGIGWLKVAGLVLWVTLCLWTSYDSAATSVPDAMESESEDLVELGRRIFSDSTISKKGIACSNCHQPANSLMDGLRVSFDGLRTGRRNTPSLLTVEAYSVFFWDGRATSLRSQVEGPVFSKAELDLDTGAVVRYMDTASVVCNPWKGSSAWKTRERSHALELFFASLVAYVRTLGIRVDDAEQRNRRVNKDTRLSMGRTIFYGKGGCYGCHVGTWYTDNDFHNTGVYPQPTIIASSYSRTGKMNRRLDYDNGRGDVVGGVQSLFSFRTPSLVRIAETAPYMHDGSMPSLRSVIDFYNRGGDAIPPQKRSLSSAIRPLHLTEQECLALLKFLNAL